MLTLAAVVAAFGPALVLYVPINALRLGVGTLLLLFGLQWLRKAVLRAATHGAGHGGDQPFDAESRQLRPGSGRPKTIDWAGFLVSFKGVFLEGQRPA